jgi:AhpD family alkylhydroperoxidase
MPERGQLRASIMDGCAYCVDMHSKDARAAGESEQRFMRSVFGARRRFSRPGSAPLRHGRRRSPK